MRRMILGTVAVAAVLALAGCASGPDADGGRFVDALVSGDTDRAAGMLPADSPIDVEALGESMARMDAVCEIGSARELEGAAVVRAQCAAGYIEIVVAFDEAGKVASIQSVEHSD